MPHETDPQIRMIELSDGPVYLLSDPHMRPYTAAYHARLNLVTHGGSIEADRSSNVAGALLLSKEGDSRPRMIRRSRDRAEFIANFAAQTTWTTLVAEPELERELQEAIERARARGSMDLLSGQMTSHRTIRVKAQREELHNLPPMPWQLAGKDILDSAGRTIFRRFPFQDDAAHPEIPTTPAEAEPGRSSLSGALARLRKRVNESFASASGGRED